MEKILLPVNFLTRKNSSDFKYLKTFHLKFINIPFIKF